MIRTETRGAVTLVTIDRPDRRNAVDLASVRELHRAVEEAGATGSRALVLTGAGGHFCAGADLGSVEDTEFVEALNRTLVSLTTVELPTIAAVDGAALGAGTQLAVACDLRVATTEARFGIPAARLGLMVDHWTVHRLTRVVGEATARAMLLGAEVYRGDRAHQLGFVQRQGTLEHALEWADEIASLAPLTIAGHKRGMDDVAAVPDASDRYRDAFRAAWSSADLQEGIAAFRDRRPPRFTGS